MNDRQHAKLDMYTSIDQYCQQNATVLAAIPAFHGQTQQLQQLIKDIHKASKIQLSATKGPGTHKRTLRVALSRSTAEIAGSLHAWSVATKNEEIAAQSKLTYRHFIRTHATALPDICKVIYNLANKNITPLQAYGITPARLTRHQAKIAGYSASIPMPRHAVILRKSAGEKLVTLFAEADALLKQQMDKTALAFKSINKDFLDNYIVLRRIKDAPVRHTGLKGVITDKKTTAPIPEARISIDATEYTATSDPKGRYRCRKIRFGTYKIIITAPGYKTQEAKNVHVKKGKITRLSIALIPL